MFSTNKFLLIIALALLPAAANAQLKGSLSGVLINKLDHKEPINYATVSIYESDSSLVSFKLSDINGTFKISGLLSGQKYKIVISAFQYINIRKEIIISDNLNLDTIFLEKKTTTLKEVIIKSELPPIIVRNDTVEFNAESFKTLPTAVVEDLLKKLNGVVVDRSGNISFNGKPVNRILVEGKEFFEGKVQIASKNLPANIVDKVQIMDDLEFKRSNPDAFSRDIPMVINLSLKKSVTQGGFGRLYAGGGLKKFYEIGGILNLFSDTTQLSILGYQNNISKSAFSLGEIQSAGGFDRSGYSSLNTGNGGSFSIDNISFGGYGEGIQKPSGTGANFNTVTKGGIKINSKYFYGLNDATIEQKSNESQALSNISLNTQKELFTRNVIESHNISSKIVYNSTPATRLMLIPSIELSPRKNKSTQNKEIFTDEGQLVSSSLVNNNRDIYNKTFKLNGDFSKEFNKKGRRLFIASSVLIRDNNDHFTNVSSTILTTKSTNQLTNQLRVNAVENTEITLRSTFSEPISKNLKLSIAFDGGFFNKENVLETFYKDLANQQYTIEIPNLTETVIQKGTKTNSTTRLIWSVSKNLSIQPSLIFGTININNNFVKNPDFKQHFRFLNPGLNIQYKQFSIQYEKTFAEPSVQYIQPIINNTDPLFVQVGNPNLLPTSTHRVYVFFRKYDVKKSINYNLYVNASIDKDGVVMSRTVNESGVQTTTPINAAFKQVSHNGSVTKSIKNKLRQITLNAGYYINVFDSPVEINSLMNNIQRYIAGSNLGIRINFHDKFELLENYSISFEKADFRNTIYENRNVATHNSESEIIIRWPKKFVFETNLSLQYGNQNLIGYDNLIKIWNVGLTYLFMKNDRAQLKFSANDLLQNNIKRYVTVNENYKMNSQFNNIGRYALLTLSYNIQNYKPKIGGKELFLGF
jgi:hypothetical protein